VGQFVLWVAVILLTLACAALALGFVALMGRYGRLLLRVEQLEGTAGAAAQPALPAGLEPGTPVPDFALPDLEGREVGLESFRGRQALLVHWSPSCGFCEAIAGDLAGLRAKLEKADTELVLLANGPPDANRALAVEHGLDCPILIQQQPVAVFEGLGTPVAYLVDAEGRIASPLALGAEQVPQLARAVADGRRTLRTELSLERSRLERDGLPRGTEAPELELETLDGQMLSLHDYRGRPVLLVFSDPECGPCSALLPELARLQDDVAIAMVTRGDAEANRAKAAEHGLDFPIAVQRGWTVSKRYGIFATPVAFLLDEEGVIAQPVAKGKDEIVALARLARTREEAPLAH
jgi:peroxiredoxin